MGGGVWDVACRESPVSALVSIGQRRCEDCLPLENKNESGTLTTLKLISDKDLGGSIDVRVMRIVELL